jgi:hypothetical protein
LSSKSPNMASCNRKSNGVAEMGRLQIFVTSFSQNGSHPGSFSFVIPEIARYHAIALRHPPFLFDRFDGRVAKHG